MQKIVRGRLALAYHDRSDGGIAVTLAEMAITGGRGLKATLPDGDVLEQLFTEQPGAVLQVADANVPAVLALFKAARVPATVIGAPCDDRSFTLAVGARTAFTTDLTYIRRAWSETTYRMQALRDNPVSAKQEYDNALDEQDPGLTFHLTYNPDDGAFKPKRGKKPSDEPAKPNADECKHEKRNQTSNT
jgi:phosphoribosylformylglycinamidine synthase